jgi:hypothetical protein
MARARKRSDDIYNARRRFRRQAERYIKKANETAGVAKNRYESMARNALEKAIASYAGNKPQGKIAQLAEKLNITQARINIVRANKAVTKEDRANFIIESKSALFKANKDKSRDDMAKDILSDKNVASAFYGGLSDIWANNEVGRENPNKAITEYYNVESIMDVIEMLENAGVDIYKPSENGETYMDIALKIANIDHARK